VYSGYVDGSSGRVRSGEYAVEDSPSPLTQALILGKSIIGTFSVFPKGTFYVAQIGRKGSG